MSLYILAVLVIVCTGALAAHYRIMMASEKDDLEQMGSTVGRVIEESLVYSMITRDAGLLDKTLNNLKDVQPINRILLLNNEDLVMAGTDKSAAGRSLPVLDARAPSADSGQGTVFRKEKTYRWLQGVRNRSECHSCHSPAALYNGSILIDFSTELIEKNITNHILKEELLFLVSFSLVGLAVFFLTNRIVIERLNRAIEAMKQFKDGRETARMPVDGNDEVTRLSLGFNEMADSVMDSQRELKQYANELLSLAVASHTVTAVPRTENLYDAVCNLAVRELKLTMAWVGLLKQDSYEVQPVAQFGFEQGYLSSIKISWDDSESAKGPTGTAIRKKTPQVVNDLTTEPAYLQWRDAAVKRGYRSSMAMPLLSSSGDLLGVLNLYSDVPGYFTRKRVRMFMIFSNQVSAEIENRTLMDNLEKSKTALARQFDLLSRSQKEWQTTFDSITDMISIHDREFRIIKANKAVADYFRLPPGEVVNRKCHDIFHDSCSIPSNCPHVISMSAKQTVTEEVRDPKTGKLFRVSTFPYYSEEGRFMGSVHVAKDITQEKETEMRLIMSERLASLGQMASGLAHEINTPLASIAGCAEGLLMKVRNGRYDAGIFEEYLQIVEEEIQRCKSITTGMLSFVRTSTYEMKDLSVNDALDKTLEIIGFQGRLQEITIERNYEDDLPVIHGSEGELRQVFLAIVINALDAMEDKGTLTLTSESKGSSVIVRIGDTGPGIAEENVLRIFDPFFTTKSEQGGTGLGLSVAYKIITNHRGTIDALSGGPSGTTFVITLPVEAPGDAQAPVNIDRQSADAPQEQQT
jgi:PAS domain S-box-containing protein